MALFPLRKPRTEQSLPAAPAQTVEALRRRALHRLIGAAVLVLAGVIGFPLVFDNQPRPIPVDLPIEIADKDKAAPLVTPPAAPAADKPAPAAAPEAPPVAAAAAPEPAPKAVAAVPEAAAPPAVEKAPSPPVPAAKTETPVAPAKVMTTPATDTARANDAQKAKALLEGKTPPAAVAGADASAPAGAARFVVQIGAFADMDKMRDARRKVERAGMKTYTQVVETKDGPRTRVRVGPFDDKAQAQQAADKIKQLDLSPSVLTL